MSNVEKSSVSALNEYCAKNQLPLPVYEWIQSDDATVFVYRVEMNGYEAEGEGRSKRDAKHAAAGNLIKIIRLKDPFIDDIPKVDIIDMPTTDMVKILRDYCVQRNLPLPDINLIQQSGTPDSPKFTVLCELSSLKTVGESQKKKDARQLAAESMHNLIVNIQINNVVDVATIDSLTKDKEYERYKKFKSYHDLLTYTNGDYSALKSFGIPLNERHNYFSNFYKELKDAAQNVLNTPYESSELKAMDLFSSLKLSPRFNSLTPEVGNEKLISIEFDCDYDVYFVNFESKIFDEVLLYFSDMLK